MSRKAMYDLSYGVFVLATKTSEKMNACITNTCIQVANSPTRVSIAVLNSNYTCGMIKESKRFNISIMDKNTKYNVVEHFGTKSGRDIDKFATMSYKVDKDGFPYFEENCCSYLACKVIDMMELGSHTLFVAEVIDSVVLNDAEPLTYAYYQSNIKPKTEKVNTEKKIKGWRCKICGYIYEGAELPADYECPLCGHPASDFEPIYE